VLQKKIAGNAAVDIEDESARLLLRPAGAGALALAQLDDHHPYDPARPTFRHRPPVKAALVARAWPDSPAGSFGFGFWNDPFSAADAPGCIWFYAGRASTAATHLEWRAGVRNDERDHETVLAGLQMADWVRFEIEWLAEAAIFRVAGVERFRTRVSIPGPLGFAIWMTNQTVYAPGQRGLRRIDDEQWLEVKSPKFG
jgi:hypothetical protein